MPVLAARTELGDRVVGLDAGADDYLAKPFAFPELAARLRALSRREPTTRPPVLEVGSLTLDPAAHHVTGSGITIALTPKEFALLQHLMMRPNEVLRRSELPERVWDMNYDAGSNVVDVHVASLRRKLEIGGESAPIDTVRGAGYRLTVLLQ
ncbi:MAG: two-component system OmpR family response regulator [Candidatus Poriferisodalaceae bacterium]